MPSFQPEKNMQNCRIHISCHLIAWEGAVYGEEIGIADLGFKDLEIKNIPQRHRDAEKNIY
ncbi:MAG: hypothetical protein HZA01_03610 [Nitrospinae bacterium]|nr:hypothetical protein [Nitrospinota bacterium]